jgi:dUTP pyrophosphatase
MASYILQIKCDDSELRELYASAAHAHEGDSGIDLYVPEDIVFEWSHEVKFVSHKIQCKLIRYSDGMPVSYWLVPRSSIAKTPLMLANSVGLIDAGYRGDIIAALRYFPNTSDGVIRYLRYDLKKHTRLVQICAPDLKPIRVQLVDSLDETTRGDSGFGSTDALKHVSGHKADD